MSLDQITPQEIIDMPDEAVFKMAMNSNVESELFEKAKLKLSKDWHDTNNIQIAKFIERSDRNSESTNRLARRAIYIAVISIISSLVFEIINVLIIRK